MLERVLLYLKGKRGKLRGGEKKLLQKEKEIK